MGLTERVLRWGADRPRATPDYELINRIEGELDAERRNEERQARLREAQEICAREGHLEPSDDRCEITSWASPTAIRVLPGCPRCGQLVEDVSVEQVDAVSKRHSAGLL